MSRSPLDGTWWHRLVPIGGVVPADAVAVIAFVVIANGVIFVPLTDVVAIRALVGLPLLFMLPGYALIAALFPGCETLQVSRLNWRVIGDGNGSSLRDRGVDFRERLALAFGGSIALLPLLAIGISLAGLPYSLDVIVPAVSGIGLFGMTVGVFRRRRLPSRQRFQIPYEQWIGVVHGGVFGQRSTVDAFLNVALAVVVVTSMAGVGYAAVTPNNGETFTSVGLMTEDNEGELVASGYPEVLNESGEELVFELQNHEGQSQEYTIVGELQHVDRTGDSLTVPRRGEVLHTSTTVDAGDTWTHHHTVHPVVTGEDLRLVYYVYQGEAPAQPDTESAYRHVNVWVDAPVQ